MDSAARDPRLEQGAPASDPVDVVHDGGDTVEAVGQVDDRRAPRYTLLIRAAKLVTSHGEFVGVIRDVSETGVSLRLFHKVPKGDPIELQMPGGAVYELREVWERGHEAGFEFTQPIDVPQLINEAAQFPRRGLRLGLIFPVRIKTLAGTFEGVVGNLSQQGARFECERLFAIDQTLRIETLERGVDLGEVRAKVRWRRNNQYGVVFDDTLTLSDFAQLAARLQDPGLLEELS